MSLPVIRGSSAANYPLKMTISFLTKIAQWQNGAEQRMIGRPAPIVKVQLPYPALMQADKNTVKSGFTSAKGSFDQTQTISLPSAPGTLSTFSNFGLDNDELAAAESQTMQYNVPIGATQSVSQSLSPGTAGQPFPVLANGAIGILPYTQKKRFQTVVQRVPAGPNYTYAEFAGGLTGYPTDGLMAWEFAMRQLSDADLWTLINHFVANFGRAYAFTFTDEDGTQYPKTRYDMDDLEITFSQVNDSALTIKLLATN